MKIGFLGAGRIATSMATTLKGMDDAVRYAVAARDLERAKAFAQEHGFEKYYGSYVELLQDPEVELVYIATPHSHHYEHARMCIDYGKPVLCEKAFTANAKLAEELIAYAEEKKVFITEAIWTRYMPSRQMIQDIIESGRLGKVVSLTANLAYAVTHKPRCMQPELAGGALLDVGIYPLNFACMVMGNEIEKVVSSCTYTETGVDEQNAIFLQFSGNRTAVLHSGMLASSEQYGVVYGTEGYLIAENINNVDKIKIYSPERELLEEIEVPKQITGYEYEVRSCMKAIREGRLECPEMPHKDTIFMMKLMDTCREQWGIRYPFE